MNSFDTIILIPIAIGFIIGLFKGFIKELFSLGAIVLGVFGAKFFSPKLANFLVNSFDFSDKTAHPIAFLLLFIVIAVGLLILAKGLEKFFESIALGGLNKLAGGIFGGLKYALLVSVLLNLFSALQSKIEIVDRDLIEKSVLNKPLMNFAPTLWEKAKQQKDKNNEHTI